MALLAGSDSRRRLPVARRIHRFNSAASTRFSANSKAARASTAPMLFFERPCQAACGSVVCTALRLSIKDLAYTRDQGMHMTLRTVFRRRCAALLGGGESGKLGKQV